MSRFTLCDHPLAQDRLARLRSRETSSREFRGLMEEVGAVLGVHALAGVSTHPAAIQTPLKAATGRRLGQPVVLAAVLRAGLGMIPGIQRLVPEADVGHIGLYRDEETLNPVRYYVRLPKNLDRSFVLLLDPMLATGGSAAEAIRILKMDGAARITLVCLLAAKPGLRRIQKEHPDVSIVAAGLDPTLNKNGYIVPGLGDAGDRLFGT